MDDATLLEAWRQGDRAAGDELLARHLDAVFRFFRTKLGDDVDDLVQRTFLGCVESRERVPADAFRPYLFGIARHRLLDHLRKQRATEARVEAMEESAADLNTSVSTQVARSQEERLLIRAMRFLPLDFQIALELAYWEEMSSTEIGRVLGISSNTVRSRLVRGRQQLRQHIERLAGSAELARSTVKVFESK